MVVFQFAKPLGGRVSTGLKSLRIFLRRDHCPADHGTGQGSALQPGGESNWSNDYEYKLEIAMLLNAYNDFEWL